MQQMPPRLAQDIRAQPVSLARVLRQHCRDGRQELLHAAALIRGAKRIVIAGIGASLNASILLENLLCSHGIDAVAVEAGELLHFRIDAYRDALFIIVSRSGESIEILKLVDGLRERNPIVAVTHEPRSTLAREAKSVLDVSSLPDEMVAIQSYTGTLLTLFLLGMAVVHQLEAAQRELDTLLPQLPNWVEANLDAIRDWDAFLDGDTPVYALGRGPSYGSALQGALLFSEIAKAPAVGMAVASFRHGPVEVVDERFKGLVFAPRGRTGGLNLALALDASRFGGQVRVIGPRPEEPSGLLWINTLSSSEMLAPLLEIVPVQVAAFRLAQLRGIAAGEFRFTPRVALDEARFPG